MSFQQYIKFMIGYVATKSHQPEAEKEKKNKQNNMYHQWFGLFPLSIKLWLSKPHSS